MMHMSKAPSWPGDGARTASDVCLIVEGCYPFVSGGVSSWLNWLMRSQGDLTFSVVAITAGPGPRHARYERPDNLIAFHELNLSDPAVLATHSPKVTDRQLADCGRLADTLSRFIAGGGIAEYREALSAIRALGPSSLAALLNSPMAWQMVQRMYATLAPQASFLQFFWAWRSLVGGLFTVATFPLPEAKAYHSISAGYAGLLSARAAIETGRPALLTEHGIYTNERRIDLMLARWLSDTIEKGYSIDDPRRDVRDVWIEAFSSFARCCYQASSHIIALFQGNQPMQRALGADRERMRVIPNGIDAASYAAIPRPGAAQRPTIALIGRVAPIKDVKTFISAIDRIRGALPEVHALIMGPTDEDPAYFDECRDLVSELGLDEHIEFTGSVRVADYMPFIHLIVLTSLSEAQPLVLLEAGAAAIPCVTTDVGCCRELIEGGCNDEGPIGAGGIVTDVIAADQVAEAVLRLLTNDAEREAMGRALRTRVSRSYTEKAARNAYSDLYAAVTAQQTASIGEAVQ